MGKFVKVKWVRINKETAMNPKVRCRLVAQELGYGSKEDELFAGTPSMTAVKMIIAKLANNYDMGVEMLVLDVKCAVLYGKMKRAVYIELPPRMSRAATSWANWSVPCTAPVMPPSFGRGRCGE